MKIKGFIKKHVLITIYLSLFVIVFLIAVYGYCHKSDGEFGVIGHLLLTIAGAPFSIVSWFFPHGSVKAIFAAGVMGTLQWYLFGKFVAFVERRR